MKEIIKAHHSEQSDGAGGVRSWFNLNETNREAYEHGRLKKFLTQTKFVMQDSILQMTRGSVKRFVDAIVDFLPISTTVNSSFDVTNVYFSEEETKVMGASKEKYPLFEISIRLSDENKVMYSTDPGMVTCIIRKTYDSGL